MTTPQEHYIATLQKLAEEMHKWGELHPDELVDIQFPDDTEVIGELCMMPQEFLNNESARVLVRHLAAVVPEATIGQFRTICEGIANAQANAQAN